MRRKPFSREPLSFVHNLKLMKDIKVKRYRREQEEKFKEKKTASRKVQNKELSINTKEA
jgi:hypothetical protein